MGLLAAVWLACAGSQGDSAREPLDCEDLYGPGYCPTGLECEICGDAEEAIVRCNDDTVRPLTDAVVDALVDDCLGPDVPTTTGAEVFRLADIRCGSFTVDGWAADFGSAALAVQPDGDRSRVYTVTVDGGNGCTYVETWTGNLYGDAAFVSSACPDGSCSMPGGWICQATVGAAAGAVAGEWTFTGALAETVPTCQAGVVTTWER